VPQREGRQQHEQHHGLYHPRQQEPFRRLGTEPIASHGRAAPAPGARSATNAGRRPASIAGAQRCRWLTSGQRERELQQRQAAAVRRAVESEDEIDSDDEPDLKESGGGTTGMRSVVSAFGLSLERFAFRR
jgi:hypothetical protein